MPRIEVDWNALREIPTGECGAPRGYCESCGLYVWSDGALKIPGIRGLFCRVLCFECELFGPGKCRWCGEKLKGAAKFCGDTCRKKSEPVKFGDGTRLLNYLARRHPGLHRRLLGQGQVACLACGDPLEGKKSGARFCDDKCRKRYLVKSSKLPKTGIIAETA